MQLSACIQHIVYAHSILSSYYYALLLGRTLGKSIEDLEGGKHSISTLLLLSAIQSTKYSLLPYPSSLSQPHFIPITPTSFPQLHFVATMALVTLKGPMG